MHDVLRLPATRLAELIRTRDLTSVGVVDAHIAAVERLNPRLNAVVANRFGLARAEARAADARVEEAHEAKTGHELPPLLGVPCTIKEAFKLTGMPNTSGLIARRGIVAEEDASTVARLRAAGAIPLGVTNLSELCMWFESSNRVYGRTNNPYDPSRIVGGSSGGEAAIIAASGSPFGLAADVGGSIRLPAFFNGVFGHKPTGGLVPNTGQYPGGDGTANRMLTTGPIARCAQDLMPLLRILAGPDGHDPYCAPMSLGDPEAVTLADLVVYNVPDNGRLKVDHEIRDAQARSATALRAAGAKIVDRRFGDLEDSFFIWGSMIGEHGPPFGLLLGDGEPVRLGRQFIQWLMRRSPHTLPALGLAALERLPISERQRARHRKQGLALGETLARTLGDRGVMLYPTFPRAAPKHMRPIFRPFDFVYTAIFNALEFPATQVPLGLNERGLPLGIQVVAAPGNDHLTIAVALFLEKIFGGWKPPQ